MTNSPDPASAEELDPWANYRAAMRRAEERQANSPEAKAAVQAYEDKQWPTPHDSEPDPASAGISAEETIERRMRDAANWPEEVSHYRTKRVDLADAIRIANEHAEAATAALRSQLDDERHARALYQDEHVTLLDERETLRRERDEARARAKAQKYNRSMLRRARSEIDGALKLEGVRDLARFPLGYAREYIVRAIDAPDEDLQAAEQERDAARAEAQSLRGLLTRASKPHTATCRIVMCGDMTAFPCTCGSSEWNAEIDAALAQEPKR